MSGRVQYAYRLYSKNNPATQISILSKVLNLYKNEYSGYEAEKTSGRAVDITLDIQSQQGLDYI
jgi:predicted adenine nucleotide alpha hydrolase (AANH) superfamily ATPase